MTLMTKAPAPARLPPGDHPVAGSDAESFIQIVGHYDSAGERVAEPDLALWLLGEELIALLDDYFDAVAAPVQAHGGEVLKFMGDGLLAIFPLGGCTTADAAESALAAVDESFARIAGLNAERHASGRSEFRIGIGMHLGEIIFGNVGAVDRLDFTAIGPSVNLACRLETLTKRVGRNLLVSHDFAGACRRPLV
jgi:adenylate cyclase